MHTPWNKNKSIVLLAILWMSAWALSSCSTRKNTLASRSYHNLVSRYNILFNGNQALEAGESQLQTELNDNYTQLLPIYKSQLPEAENMVMDHMSYAIEKSNKLIHKHSITAKPKRRRRKQSKRQQQLAQKNEYNNWVDDAYFLSGKAHYYLKDYLKAVSEFDYIVRQFPEQNKMYYQSLIWLLRCYTSLKMNKQAEEIMGEVKGSLQFPPSLNADFDLAEADYHLQQADYRQTQRCLESALLQLKDKSKRTRYHYILAQLYAQSNEKQLAASHYQKVSGSKTPYPMRFSAKLAALELSANESNQAETLAELNKLLQSEQNQSYTDQIYYALAKTALQVKNQAEAINYLKQSVAAHRSNDSQLILSCSTLSAIYYQREDFISSASYLDSLFTVLQPAHPNFESLSAQHKRLTKLSEELRTIQREDSLQQLASMSETQRNSLVSKWIAEQKEQDRKEQWLLNQALQPNASAPSWGKAKQSNSWYFYNPQTVEKGAQQFARNWGKRQLEDNWRRQHKNAKLFVEAEEMTEEARAENKQTTRVTDDTRAEYYLQDIPQSAEEWQASNEKIKEALFLAGQLFKYDFKNYKQAAQSYEQLLNRFPNSQHQLICYFELWDSYLAQHNQQKSDHYKTLILHEYPNSRYAQYLSNPNFLSEQEAHRTKLEKSYQEIANHYQKRDYSSAARKAKQLRLACQSPDSSLVQKLEFIICVGENRLKTKEVFGEKLRNFSQKYPNTELAVLAEDIRQLLADNKLNDYQAMLQSGYISEKITSVEEKATIGNFSKDPDAIYYFAISYESSPKIDLNRLRFDIASYNIDHYLKTDFDLEISPIGARQSILLVKTFFHEDQAAIYLRSIRNNQAVFNQLKDTPYRCFIISNSNLRRLLHLGQVNDYLSFYRQHYSQAMTEHIGKEPSELISPEELAEQVLEDKNKTTETGRFVLLDAELDAIGTQPTKEPVETIIEKPVEIEKPVAIEEPVEPIIEEPVTTVVEEPVAEEPVAKPVLSFQKEAQATHLFVIAIEDTKMDLASMVQQFKAFNKASFASLQLQVNTQQADDYQLLLISSTTNAEEGMSYFRQTVRNRNLFSEIDQKNYRNFLISPTNLQIITQGKLPLDAYVEFFKAYYLSDEYKQ